MEFYIDKNGYDTGDHQVHRADCSALPDKKDLEYLGDFLLCSFAIAEAKKKYKQVIGCPVCSVLHYTRDS